MSDVKCVSGVDLLADYLEGLLADEKKLMSAIVDELKALKTDFGDTRRTQIVDSSGEITMSNLLPGPSVICLDLRLTRSST